MFKTEKPFGLIYKDLIWVYQNVKSDNIVLLTSYDLYLSTPCKKKHIFVIHGAETYLRLCGFSNKERLKGRFIIIDTEQQLQRIKAIILDKEGMNVDINAFIKCSLPFVKCPQKFHKAYLEKESNRLLNILKNRIVNQKDVFKKTYQNIHNDFLESAKQKLKPSQFGKYKKYLSELLTKVVTNHLPYDTLIEIKLGNNLSIKCKDAYRDVVKYCAMGATIRTIQTFHDIIINGTDKDKALLENYGDAYTLNMFLESWYPNKNTKFPYNYTKAYKKLHLISKNSLLSKDLVKDRNKKDVVKSDGKFVFQIRSGIMILDHLIQKLKLPEDEYRVVGTSVKDNKVLIETKEFALHGIHTNQVYSVRGC